MIEFSRYSRTSLLGFCLLITQGCQQEGNEGFHTFKDDTATVPAESVTAASASPTGVNTASTETPALSPEVTSPQPTPPHAEPAPSVTTTAPAPSPLPSVLTETPAPQPPAPDAAAPSKPIPNHELALEIPPEPPVAVSLAAIAAATPSAPARKMELLIPEKSFKVEGPEGAIRVTFDDIDLLKVLNADPVPLDVEQHLPPWLSGLNGKMVRIRGWMFPPNQETDIPAFLFVRDNQICCFGRKPMVYDKFGVRLREGVTTNYILGRPFDVIGRMMVKSRIQNDELFWLYLIEDAIVVDQ